MNKQFKIKLIKSLIKCSQKQKDSIRCLGLKKLHQQVIVKDNPAIRGQIKKVQHLLECRVEKWVY